MGHGMTVYEVASWASVKAQSPNCPFYPPWQPHPVTPLLPLPGSTARRAICSCSEKGLSHTCTCWAVGLVPSRSAVVTPPLGLADAASLGQASPSAPPLPPHPTPVPDHGIPLYLSLARALAGQHLEWDLHLGLVGL